MDWTSPAASVMVRDLHMQYGFYMLGVSMAQDNHDVLYSLIDFSCGAIIHPN